MAMKARSRLMHWWKRPSAPESYLTRLLRESLPEHRGKYVVAMVAMMIVAAATAASAWLMGEIIDAIFNPDDRARVFFVAAMVAGVFIIKGVASYIQIVLLAKAGNSIVAQKQEQLYDKLLSQSLGYFTSTESSDILLRITQTAQTARHVINTIVVGFVRDLLTLVGLVMVMFYQQPFLSLVCFIVGPVAIYGVQKILKRVRGIAAQELASLAEIIRVVRETATGVRVIKALALEDAMSERMRDAVGQVEKRANKIARLQAATTPLMDTLTGFTIASIVALSTVTLFGENASTPGQLMSFVTAFLMAYEPAKRISRMRVVIESGMVGVRMMYEMIDQPRFLEEADDAIDLPEGPGTVALKNVSFSYVTGQSVLTDLSLNCAPGQTLALVGPSGGGKSTILNLMLRLYDPTAGQVTIDGQDLHRTRYASLRQKIAYVGQDTFLFSATIMENLRIARPSASDADVYEAARIAHADEFIQDLPQGYDTPIGENGAFLSGGQRQRLAIARAVLRKAPILLLDEATSALDSQSETLVRDALQKITQGVTTIVVAHRLSTVLRADQICYIDKGRIVEMGTLESLLAANGPFRKLYDQQFAHSTET